MTEKVEFINMGVVKVCARTGTGRSPDMKISVVWQIWNRTAAEKENLGGSRRFL